MKALGPNSLNSQLAPKAGSLNMSVSTNLFNRQQKPLQPLRIIAGDFEFNLSFEPKSSVTAENIQIVIQVVLQDISQMYGVEDFAIKNKEGDTLEPDIIAQLMISPVFVMSSENKKLKTKINVSVYQLSSFFPSFFFLLLLVWIFLYFD